MINNWPDAIAPWASFGAGAGAGFVFLKWFLDWIAGRMDKRHETIERAAMRLMEGLEKRVDDLTIRLDIAEKELRECQRKHAESDAEVMRLKALLQGYGDARQKVAVERAAEKVGQKG